MLRSGQVPGSWFGEMPDVLAMLRSAQSPGGGAGDGGNGGDGQAAGGSAGGQGGAGDGQTGRDGQPFDAERAQRTIAALREEVKAGKANKAALDDALARLKAIEDKDKTDSEKLTGDLKTTAEKLSKAEQRAAELEAKYTRAQIGAAIEREAGKANAVDVETVAALVNRSEITIDEAGTVTGADKAVAALLKAKPFLVGSGSAGGTVKGTPGTPNSAGAPSKDELIKQAYESQQKTGLFNRM